MPFVRDRYGLPPRDAPQSQRYEVTLLPTSGFTSAPSVTAADGSFTSGMNVWVRHGEMVPRPRLSAITSQTIAAAAGDENTYGFSSYAAVDGRIYPVIYSAESLYYYTPDYYGGSPTGSGWSGRSTFSFNPANQGPVFGASIYLPRRDINIFAFSSGTLNPIQCWSGPVDGMTSAGSYSLLTGSPNAGDIVAFQNNLMVWNVCQSGTTAPTRVQWTVAGDPEDWTGFGSGAEDLVAMRGAGTRVFAQEDQLLLASESEIWRGRATGPPFFFEFSPMIQTVGIPYKRAALQTPWGIFWLGNDMMVRNLVGNQLFEVGQPIQRELLSGLDVTSTTLEFIFFTFNAELRTVTLYAFFFNVTGMRTQWTYHVDSGVWTPHRMATAHRLIGGISLYGHNTLNDLGTVFFGGV